MVHIILCAERERESGGSNTAALYVKSPPSFLFVGIIEGISRCKCYAELSP
jgi:hypothetical protein